MSIGKPGAQRTSEKIVGSFTWGPLRVHGPLAVVNSIYRPILRPWLRRKPRWTRTPLRLLLTVVLRVRTVLLSWMSWCIFSVCMLSSVLGFQRHDERHGWLGPNSGWHLKILHGHLKLVSEVDCSNPIMSNPGFAKTLSDCFKHCFKHCFALCMCCEVVQILQILQLQVLFERRDHPGRGGPLSR